MPSNVGASLQNEGIERPHEYTTPLGMRSLFRRSDGPGPEVLSRKFAGFTLVAVTLFGAALRFRGLSNGGLFRDDAWVALSARVGLGTAWHMWVTAPGFYFLERTWIATHPGSTEWDQFLPLAAGIASIPAAYLLIRYYRMSRFVSLGGALIVSISPVCIIYSTRLKESGVDFLLACLMLILGEAARRRQARRDLLLLAIATIFCFALSASTLAVIIGVVAGCWPECAFEAQETVAILHRF
jgi:hypothetical protein